MAKISVDEARELLALQPFSRLIGTELVEISEGKAVLALVITENVKQQHGYVHGGVISYLADNTLSYAGGSVLGPSVLMGEFKVNFLSPGVGEKLIARAWVLSTSKRQSVCRCDVFSLQNGQERLCAAAQGTIIKIGGTDESSGAN